MEQLNEFVANNLVLFFALVVIIVLLLRTWIGPGQVKGLSPFEAIQKVNKEDAVILDVRTDAEYSEGYILNSVHIPLGLLDSGVNKLAQHKEQPIIICCRAGSRSRQAAVMLKKHGCSTIFQLQGGIMAWQNANLPLTKTSKQEAKKSKAKKKVKKSQVENTTKKSDLQPDSLEAKSETEESSVAEAKKIETK